MKRLVLTLMICLGCFGFLEAQDNIWKPINTQGLFLGAGPDGSLFAHHGYSGLARSQDEGATWQIVAGYQTGFDYYFNIYCFCASPEGRVFVFNDDLNAVVYSDDNGDTWQQMPQVSSCALTNVKDLYATSNETVIGWTSNGEVFWTTDGGETWGYSTLNLDENHQVSDMIVKADGDVYAGVNSFGGDGSGIFHSTLSDMQNWTLAAFEGASVQQMVLHPDGSIVAGTFWGEISGFQQEPGFYLIDAMRDEIAISDNGITYCLDYYITPEEITFVLAYSGDYGEHLQDVGESFEIAASGGGRDGYLYKGYDNYLYLFVNGQYYKSIQNADEIIAGTPTPYYPLVHEGNDRQKWNVVYMGSMNYPNDYHTEIQSIRDNINLDGVDYKLVWTESVYQSKRIAGAVREEDKRVYFRRYWGQSYEDEVLLYDFNLTVGDTVAVGWSDYQLIVLEESQVEVNGTMRRQLGLAEYFAGSTNYEVEEYWIEGVGSTYGFLNSGYEGWVGAFVHLLCYHENGDLVWDNEAFDDCVMNSEGTPASFAPQEAEWYFDVFDPWGTHPEYERFYVDGDTVIQGHQCSIIIQHFVDTGHDGEEYVYEENNKVYWFNPTTNAFSTLYDFDAEAGESWYYEVGECSHLAIVDSVGSVTWNGHTYRTQWVTFNDDFPVYYIYHRGRIIEGIGYERGLFPNYYICNGLEVYDYSEIEYLRCYVDDGEMLYHEGEYDCDQSNIVPPSHPEWYYEIQNENGTITYQYMYQAGDTIIQDEPTHILVRINTLYDKGLRDEVTHEYVFELNGKVYWWNSTLGMFTVLYDYEAEVGDSWNIFVGTEILTMHVDAVEEIEYEGRVWRMLCVSDPENLFSGNIVCGIGHLTSFFPERLMNNGDGVRVEGMRCYWVDDELVFKIGDEDCDAIYSEVHGVEEDGPSTGSGALTVYPNPTDGVLFVQTLRATSLPSETYCITNLMGQTVLSGNITAETQQIDVSGLAEGMYFISVGGMTVKFIKQ